MAGSCHYRRIDRPASPDAITWAGRIGMRSDRRCEGDSMGTTSAEASASGAVVVGYDGSADADCGLDWAIEYARRLGLPVEVVAASGDVTYLPERTNQEVDSLVEEWLALAERRLTGAGLDSWHTRVTREKAVPSLLQAGHDAA